MSYSKHSACPTSIQQSIHDMMNGIKVHTHTAVVAVKFYCLGFAAAVAVNWVRLLCVSVFVCKESLVSHYLDKIKDVSYDNSPEHNVKNNF